MNMTNLGTARGIRELVEVDSWTGPACQTRPRAGHPDVYFVGLAVHTHERESGFWPTVDHGLTTTYTSLVITWIRRTSSGCVTRPYQPDPRTIANLDPILDGADFSGLFSLWTRWHAQGLAPGCTHQTPPPRADVAEALAACPPCPVDGYEFGSGWLVRDLPYDVRTRARQIGHALETAGGQGW